MKLPPKNRYPFATLGTAELRRHAEVQVKKQRRGAKASGKTASRTDADMQRLLHELQVHQIELELQNEELRKTQEALAEGLDKYTELYDFAPVGYFTLTADSKIQMVNLTGARLVGVDRSRLLGQRLNQYINPSPRSNFSAFLRQVFAEEKKQSCDVIILYDGLLPRAVSIEAKRSPNGRDCHAIVVDITESKLASDKLRRIDMLAIANQKLEQEITRRQTVEDNLKQVDRHQRQLLEQAHHAQDQLRQLSRKFLKAQENERKRISRELHDVVAQTLVGINVRLAMLKNFAQHNAKELNRNIDSTQRMVDKSVEVIHRFARELRPAVLDDLGLIPALHSYLKTYSTKTGLQVHLKAFSGVEKLGIAKRTVLYRVAQEALSNISHHARASRVDVLIQELPGGVSMQITDDGRSFKVNNPDTKGKSKRLGLLGMRERMEMVGGTFSIESTSGKGTTVVAHIPMDNGTKENSPL